MTSRFCLIISSMRSGSTLLCSDLSSLEVLGNPREIPEFLRNRSKAFDHNDYKLLLNDCHTTFDGKDIYSFKMMLHYGPKVIEGAMPGVRDKLNLKPWESAESNAEFYSMYCEHLEKEFDQVLIFIVNRRDVIAQTHSRIIAQLTNEWHLGVDLKRNINKDKRRTEINVDNSILFDNMLKNISKTYRDYIKLEFIKKKFANKSNCLSLDYSDLVDFNGFSHKLSCFLDSNNIVVRNKLTRRLKKVVDKDLQNAHCSAFKEWLGQFSTI